MALLAPSYAGAAGLSRQVIEEEITYKAVKGDYLIRIAGKNGVELKVLLSRNPHEGRYVYPGDTFSITRRTIVPVGTDEGILINIPDRTLYLFRGGKLEAHYPVCTGRRGWKTPLGEFKVVHKEKNPTWHVPKNIQREMARKGERVRTIVKPGDDNPLGRFAVKTSIDDILIHETIWPESIYQFRSHGCVRLKPGDAEAFYNSVSKGDTGSIIYEPVKVAETTDGRIFLEVQPDPYGSSGDMAALVKKELDDYGLSGRVDWDKVAEVIKAGDSMAADVTKH